MNRFKRLLAENLRQPKGVFGWMVGRFMNHFNDGIIQQTIQLIPEIKNQSIVEVGVGSGKALQLAERKFGDAMFYGLDISTRMMKSAKSRNRRAIDSGKMELHQCPIDNVPVNSASVDTLYTINTIYFWDDLDEGCREVNRVLKKGGHFIISFNPKENMKKEMYPSDLFHFVSSDEVINLVERNGFEKISLHHFDDRYEKYASIVAKKVISMNSIEGHKTERIEFRRLTKKDIPLWLTFLQEPKSGLYIGLGIEKKELSDAEEWIDRQIERNKENGLGLYAFVDIETQKMIGQCGLIPREIDGQDELEIAYHVLPEYRRMGYASEAATAAKEFAKTNKLKESLISIIHIDNMASQKVALKNGLKRGVKTKYMEMDVFIYRVVL